METELLIEFFNSHKIEITKFEEKHKSACFDKFHDVSGALISYTFIPTGLGLMATIECSCGEKLLISDFN